MDFSTALELIKQGYRLARKGWNGRSMFVEMQEPDRNSKMTLPYIYISTVTGDLVPWLVSQTDLFACDWELVVD